MTIHSEADLSRLFSPKSVVLLGASQKSAWTKLIVANHKKYGFDSRLHLVGRSGGDIDGHFIHTTLESVGDDIDLAYVALPKAAIQSALEDVVASGIPGVSILTSGYAEIGETGRNEEAELVAYARENGIKLLGPNSLGFVNLAHKSGVCAIPPYLPILEGGLGIIGQSGFAANEMMGFAQQQGIGYAFSIAIGNEAMVGCADVMRFMIDEPAVKTIVMFLEAIRDPDAFREAAARAKAAGKPIVIVKLGRSQLAGAVAQSHTGGLVGDDRTFDAFCERFGIIRVSTLEQAVMTAHVVSSVGKLEKPGVAFVSNSGGSCGLLADLSEETGLPLPEFSEKTRAALREVSSDFGTILNPFDVTGAYVQDPTMFERIIKVIGEDDSVGLIGVVNTIPATKDRDATIAVRASISRGLSESQTPGGLVSQCLRPVTEYGRDVLKENPMPFVVGGFDDALVAFSKLIWWSERVDRVAAPEPDAAPPTRRLDSEVAALEFLGETGVPVVPITVAKTAQEAVDAAAALEGPVAMKVASPDILHKTEVGGVRLNVTGDTDCARAFEEIISSARGHKPDASIDGVIVAPMRKPQLELLVGTHRDDQWGTSIVIGLGGIWVEVFKDTSMRLLPITETDAIEMLKELKAWVLLNGFRGSEPADVEALAKAIVAIGNAALALGPELRSLEVNPLMVDGQVIEALDAMVEWISPNEMRETV